MTRYAAFPVATALGALLAATPLALAQQSGKVFQIGILSPAGSPATKAFDALRNGLREFGYIEGSNIKIEYRLADWDYGRLPAMAADLVRLPVDVIVTDGGPRVVSIAQEATHTIPIVAATAGADPVTAGLAASLAHPGGNVTGFAGLGSELSGKRLQLLKEAVPRVTRVGVLRVPESLLLHLQATEEAARTLGLELRIAEAAAPDIPAGFEAAVSGGAEALVVLPNAMFWNERARIAALAARHRLPAIYEDRGYAIDGGLLTYGRDVSEQFRLTAGYVDKILKGAKPSDLPIQQPTRFQLVVNLKTAKALGLTIAPAILDLADEVIE